MIRLSAEDRVCVIEVHLQFNGRITQITIQAQILPNASELQKNRRKTFPTLNF